MAVWLRLVGVVLSVGVVLAGCGSGDQDESELRQRTEERALETRTYVDGLAERLGGKGVDVVGDDIGPCEPGDDEGLDLVYSLRVRVAPGAADRLRGEIADELESDGWTVRQDADQSDEVSVRFLRGTFSMGVVVDTSVGVASVSGSGGCVR